MPYTMRHPAKDLILAIDIGTTSMKGGLISPEGVLLGEHRVIYRDKGSMDYLAWDAQVWVDSLRDIVATLGGFERTKAVCVSGQGPTVVPISEEGMPLFYALLWIDQRRSERPNTKSFFIPKIAWFKENFANLYQQTRWFLSCPEFINYFLTGKAATVSPNPEFHPYFWSAEELKAYHLDAHRFPEFVESGQIIGLVTERASRLTGIPPGVPVVAGGSDFLMALLGSATVEVGCVCDRAGTSEGVNLCCERPLDVKGVRTLPHIIPGLFNASGILSSTGRLFEWLRQITGQVDRTYRDIIQDIANLPTQRSRPLFVPALRGDEDFQFAEGAFLDLHPEHDRRDLGRAVVESIGFGIRKILDTFEESGYTVKEVRVTGGQARNVIWNQMKADMTGCIVLVPEIEDAELLGCAICALTALGNFPTLVNASKSLMRLRARYTPREDRYAQYQQAYMEYWDRWKKSMGNL